jgi:hypothetical protein
LEFHSESLIGAISLDEDHVKLLRSLFKCPQCHANLHTFPSCPFLKHWSIKKKTRSDVTPDTSTSGAVWSAYVQSQSDDIPTPSSSSEVLDTIEESFEEDFDSSVEFDLLYNEVDNLEVNSTNGDDYPYSVFKVPLGLARSISSYSDSSLKTSLADHFDVIIDSGCTKHMFPDRPTFITYIPCLHSFVILANKSKTACLGTGTVQLLLGGKSVILHDVLHVPNL